MPHHIPGYTGYLAGGQNQLGKTFGQASEAAIHERTADQDPLKWRKYVSYAEFTPAKTPSEGHHIPGYSGVVPGMYAENLYAKTYGKATLQAVEGRFPRGVEQNADEQYKTSMEVAFNMDNGHPGKPSDIAHGGVSWAGASPYNLQTDATAEKLEPMNQWPPSTVQIAGGKEPVKTSVLMHNFHEGKDYSASSEPAIRIQGKEDPHNPTDPAKKTTTKTEGVYHIPGYSGFVPGVQAENIFSDTFARTTAKAETIRDRQRPDEVSLKIENIGPYGKNGEMILPSDPPKPPALRSGEMETTRPDGPNKHSKHLPGYTGFIAGVESESIFGMTFGHASHVAIEGKGAPARRFQWRPMTTDEQYQSSAKNEMLNFGHAAKIQDGHITYLHETNNPMDAAYRKQKNPVMVGDYHIPGYGGFVPHVQSRNMFGLTTHKATATAMTNAKREKNEYNAKNKKDAPPPTTAPDLGMIQFKPEGFMYQKRMQGEWNAGMLGSRNYSAVRLSEGRHWKGNLYGTTINDQHQGHRNYDCPHIFSKGPEPKFENMDHAMKHKSVYLGFYGN